MRPRAVSFRVPPSAGREIWCLGSGWFHRFLSPPPGFQMTEKDYPDSLPGEIELVGAASFYFPSILLR